MQRTFWILGMVTSSFLGLAGCASDAPTCTPGASQACACANGSMGAQLCAAEGDRFEPCECTGGDAGADDAGLQDAGPDGGSCSPLLASYPSSPACDASTGTCIDGCGGGDCPLLCIQADANEPACSACFSQAQQACATQNGCDLEFGCLVACIDAHCTSGSDPNCFGGGDPCETQYNAFTACQTSVAAGCTNLVIAACIP